MLAGRLPASQALADRLARGYFGMIVRSFAAGSGERDLNAVFWRWSEEPPAMVRVVDDEAGCGVRPPDPALRRPGLCGPLPQIPT